MTKILVTIREKLPPEINGVYIAPGADLPKIGEQVIIKSAASFEVLTLGAVSAVNAVLRTYDVRVGVHS